ncbi:MAG: dephospho-CoA kinase [Bacteroidales bacterium]|nr:dephospho-CoA kinase [Bacteroidales bacterium]
MWNILFVIMNELLNIGLTGNIGSGKSTIAKALKIMGYPVYHSDIRARQMYYLKPVRDEIYQLLGDDAFENEQINLKKLAGIIFQDDEKLKAVNSIIHPRVAKDYRDWLMRQKASVVFQETALLFETGMQSQYDAVITVIAPGEIRLKRTMKRDTATREEVMRRLKHQMDEQKKADLADFVIVNDDKQAVLPQVLKILSVLDEQL